MGEEKCRQEIALLPLAELVYSRIAGWTFEPAIPTHIVVVAVAVFFTEKLRNPALGQFYLSRSGGRYRCPLMAKMEKESIVIPRREAFVRQRASGTCDISRSYFWTRYSAAWMELVDLCKTDRRD